MQSTAFHVCRGLRKHRIGKDGKRMLHQIVASSIGVIGGADGPTAVFVTAKPGMENVMEALGIMGKGMLGIFAVVGLIALIVLALTKAGNK